MQIATAQRDLYALSCLVWAVLFLAALPAAAQEPDWDAVEFKTTDLGDGMHLLQGMGGNIAVSTGADGTLVIDDDFAPLSPKLSAAIQALSAAPIRYVLNTHWHADHTGGNAALNSAATTILAHDNVRTRLLTEAPPAALPELTFSDTATLHFNGHEFLVFHVHAAHTDGDAIVHIKDLDLIHAGDILFNGMYPFIDLSSGGSVGGVLAALKALLALAGPETRIIAGHGPVAARQDLQRTISMIADARASVAALAGAGKSLAEVQQIDPLAAYHERYAWFFISGERFTEILYQDAQNQNAKNKDAQNHNAKQP